MKKYTFLVAFLSMSLLAQSQVTRLFLDTNRSVISDSTKARFYFLQHKLNADSAYSGAVYNLRGDLLSVGTYKAENMKMPHGKFTYYGYNLLFNKDSTQFSINEYVCGTGFYSNGIKVSMWNYYYFDGSRAYMYTYNKDKLNGLYERYGTVGNVLERGNYLDNLKEGEWDTFNGDSVVLSTDMYKQGVLIKHTANEKINSGRMSYIAKHAGTMKARPEFSLNTYLTNALKNKIPDGIDGVLVARVSVNRKGKVSKPVIVRELNKVVDAVLINALLQSPDWKPAFDREYQRDIDSYAFCTITFVNSRPISNFYNGYEVYDPYF